jgi:hypothetical protein
MGLTWSRSVQRIAMPANFGSGYCFSCVLPSRGIGRMKGLRLTWPMNSTRSGSSGARWRQASFAGRPTKSARQSSRPIVQNECTFSKNTSPGSTTRNCGEPFKPSLMLSKFRCPLFSRRSDENSGEACRLAALTVWLKSRPLPSRHESDRGVGDDHAEREKRCRAPAGRRALEISARI